MFTHHTALARRAGGALGSLALTAGILIAPLAATADEQERPSSYAEARFLSGSLAGADLVALVALDAAIAHNDGTQPKLVTASPLGATVLDSIMVNDPDGIQLALGSVLDAGIIGQYAEAESNGASYAAAGAVGSDGAVGIGSVGTGKLGDLGLDLDALITSEYASILTDLSLNLHAVTAEARAQGTTATGDYRLAGAELTFSSPAISDLTAKVAAALAKVEHKLVELSSDDGALGNAVDGVLDPLLGVVGSSANVSIVIDADIREAVDALLTDAHGDGSVRFNLESGTVTLDLAKLLGGHLNDLPEGTELLQNAVVGQALRGITRTVSTLADQIVDRVRQALNDATVDVRAALDVLSAGGTSQHEVCRTIDVPILGDVLGGGGVDELLGGGGPLGGLLGKSPTTAPLHQDIIGWTTETVCELVGTATPGLRSTVDVHVAGTVHELLGGTATQATAALSLLGGTVSAHLNVDLVVDALAAGLATGLFGHDGAVSDLTEALHTGLVDPALEGLLGDTSVHGLLTEILSVSVNNKDVSTHPEGSMFTQSAVRIAVAGGAVAVDVASAAVGPNVASGTCVVDCGPGGDPDPCVSGCTPGHPIPTGTNPGGLAMTGVGVAMLIQLILALLVAGAALAYAGHKKRHPAAVVEG